MRFLDVLPQPLGTIVRRRSKRAADRDIHRIPTLASQMIGAETVEVVLSSPEITLHGDRATLVVDATVLGGRYFPDRAERLRITSGWRLEDGEWRCYTADWDRP